MPRKGQVYKKYSPEFKFSVILHVYLYSTNEMKKKTATIINKTKVSIEAKNKKNRQQINNSDKIFAESKWKKNSPKRICQN